MHLPGDEIAEYRHPPGLPLSVLCAEVGAEMGVPGHTVFFESATNGAKFADSNARLCDLFPGASKVGLIAQCDPSRPRPVVPGREGEPEEAGKLGGHRVIAPAAASASRPQASASNSDGGSAQANSSNQGAQSASSTPRVPLKPAPMPGSRPLIPISSSVPPPHLAILAQAQQAQSQQNSARLTPPHSARSPHPPAPSSAGPGPAMPHHETISSVAAVCRELEPMYVSALDRFEKGQAGAGSGGSRGSSASATPIATTGTTTAGSTSGSSSGGDAAAAVLSLDALGPLLGLKADVMRRHGFASDAEFKAACTSCQKAATALTDRQAAPPSSLSAGGGSGSLNVVETSSLNADAILQSTGLGLAVVWANKFSRAEERFAKAVNALRLGMSTLPMPATAVAGIAPASMPADAAASVSQHAHDSSSLRRGSAVFAPIGVPASASSASLHGADRDGSSRALFHCGSGASFALSGQQQPLAGSSSFPPPLHPPSGNFLAAAEEGSPFTVPPFAQGSVLSIRLPRHNMGSDASLPGLTSSSSAAAAGAGIAQGSNAYTSAIKGTLQAAADAAAGRGMPGDGGGSYAERMEQLSQLWQQTATAAGACGEPHYSSRLGLEAWQLVALGAGAATLLIGTGALLAVVLMRAAAGGKH